MSNSSFYSNTGITSADVSSITSAKEAAATSETNAATSATEAANSATQAATSATNAASSETNVSNSAATATTSAANASTSETNASASAATATTQASNAATSATAAAGSASTAGTSATNAASSATNAATSETNAATSETNAANSATSAATSATNAGTSETNAAASASSASGYVTSATTQANNAATSATAAATSETNAASSATAASTSASGASTSASNANTSATNAASSASQAATSAAAAALAADNFDDTYLGSNASDPTTDNDGDALNAGDLHFNTSSNTLKVYNGSAWQDAAIDSSGFVQTTGDTMTGNLSMGDNVKAIFGAGSDLNVWHNGSHSYVQDTGTGNLYLAGSNVIISNPTATETMAYFDDDGGASLWYDNSVKLATTSTGIDVTGTVTADGLTSTGSGANTTYFIGGDDSIAGRQLTLSSEANGGQNNATHRLTVPSGYGSFNVSVNSAERLKIDNNGDISFYEDTGTTPKMVWKSADERLGIGTSSPSKKAHLYASNDSASLRLENTANSKVWDITPARPGVANTGLSIHNVTDDRIDLHVDNSGNVLIGQTDSNARLASTSTTNKQLSLRYTGVASYYTSVDSSGNYIIDKDGSERMRLTSAGDLLVGQSTTTVPGVGNTTAGVSIRGDDGSFFSRSLGSGDTNNVVTINRSSNSGNILGFAGDGTIVGSINVGAGNVLAIGQGSNYIQFHNSLNSFYASDGSVGRDNAMDIGTSGVRFKDLYLSGGVYLGGTGSANKLDDYEEGTWTPTIFGSTSGALTLASTEATYVKIGNQVTVSAKIIQWTANSGLVGMVALGGLPFTSQNTYRAHIGGFGGSPSGSITINGHLILGMDGPNNYCWILRRNNSDNTYDHTPTFSSSGIIYGMSWSYFTS